MTTTNIYGGYDQKRPTSKVLNPPGGKSNFSLFGGGDDEATSKPTNAKQAERNKSSVFGTPEQAAPAASAGAASKKNPTPPAQVPPSASAGASARQQSTNPITGEPTTRPSTKVMAPPGGASSGFIFG